MCRVVLMAAAGLALLALSAVAVAVVGYRVQYEPLAEGTVADRVLVEKNARRLTLYRHGQSLKVYHVALGPTPVGHKEFRGGTARHPRVLARWTSTREIAPFTGRCTCRILGTRIGPMQPPWAGTPEEIWRAVPDGTPIEIRP